MSSGRDRLVRELAEVFVNSMRWQQDPIQTAAENANSIVDAIGEMIDNAIDNHNLADARHETQVDGVIDRISRTVNARVNIHERANHDMIYQ